MSHDKTPHAFFVCVSCKQSKTGAGDGLGTRLSKLSLLSLFLCPLRQLIKTLSLCSSEEVIVTHMVSPGEFYVQFMDKHRELQRLMNKINTYCRTPHPLKHIRAGR